MNAEPVELLRELRTIEAIVAELSAMHRPLPESDR
jgi:hypothetical protein